MKKIFLLLCLFPWLFAEQVNAQEKKNPILTIACLSDVHSMNSMITPTSGNLEDIHPRSSFLNTIDSLKKHENIDVLVMGGDNISDKTFAQANYEQHRTVLAAKAREAFQSGKSPYVLYVNGNHEYEVANFDALPKTWNAGDYYSTIMKNDIGTLADNECFYEMADNGSQAQMKLLTAYHYQLYGYDFVVMNTGKYFFKSAWDYQVSDEAVAWVDQKLDEIYAKNPDKVVFFLMHVPFSDSNSLNSGKGLTVNTASTNLKKALAKHHNLVMLYGHDHGKDSAYTRKYTSQRATVYDENGNVLPTTDSRHINGTTESAEEPSNPSKPDAEGRVAQGDFYMWNAAAGKYINVDDNNITLSTSPLTTSYSITNSIAKISMSYGGTSYGLHIGSNGRYSRGDASEIMLFRVISSTQAVRAERVKAGENYLVVAQYNSAYYAMNNSVYSAGTVSQRLNSTQVTISGNTITLPSNSANIQWTLKEINSEPSTPSSFMSLFMGSMRYYYNAVDAADPADLPQIVQALLVYVYEDSVVFKIKNYNKTGDIASGIHIDKYPASYTMVMDRKISRVYFTDDKGNKDSCDVHYGDDFEIKDTYKSLQVTEPTPNLNLTYTRNFTSQTAGHWQAWYMPCNFDYDDLKSDFDVAEIAGVLFDQNGENYVAFKKMSAGIIKAHTPYVVRAKEVGDAVVTTTTTLQSTSGATSFSIQSAYNNFTFGGVYENTNLSAEYPTYALSKTGTFSLMGASVYLRPFRIFMQIFDRDDNPYAAVTTPSEVKVVVLGEDETEITDVDDAADVDGEIYNLAGQRVVKLQKGINIVNGRKVMY